MRVLLVAAALTIPALLPAQESGARGVIAFVPVSENLSEVKRVYVEELKGGAQADALRALIIASLDSTKLFILTENEDHADAVLKGAADDHTFTDTFDSDENVSTRENAGKSSGAGTTTATRASGGAYGGFSVGENESYHIKERKHQAYASVRLCNKDGDVLWSTTQESLGAKFHSASADVADKIARQLTLDMDRARHTPTQTAATK